MSMLESLAGRRTIYALKKELPEGVDEKKIEEIVEKATELVPDAFNMKSQRVVLLFGEKSAELWDKAYDAFGGQVAREKLDGFAAGAGTILFYTDQATVDALAEQFSLYAANFPIWASQSNGMLQLAVWSALADEGVGASLQHYNPVIDEAAAELAGVPAEWKLVAQMPFGGIASPADAKPGEEISERVKVIR